MPRISRKSSFHEYSPPDPSSGRLIGVSDVDHAELLGIANSKYSDSHFSCFAYSVSKSRFRSYVDDFFADFIESVPVESGDSTVFSSEKALTFEQPVRCLVFNAFCSPLSAAQEFKFIKGTDFLTGIGIYSISSRFGFGDESKKLALEKVAQYSLQSHHNLSLTLITAIVQPDSSWELALGQIHVHRHSNKNCASIEFALFDPEVFVCSILAEKGLKDAQHVSFNSFIQLFGDMSYYKSV
ncbi:hypothetical protein [Cohnella yongneupensis]|uniref:Uncharacterized protein n=1 Tax=Cohnella yongneupensis TaxID=425006 RepID=A0ABW0QTT1_9BACL